MAIPFYGVCVDACPDAGDVLSASDGDGQIQTFDVALNTTDVLYRCLPVQHNNNNNNAAQRNTTTTTTQRNATQRNNAI
jgi:hypothetical protein